MCNIGTCCLFYFIFYFSASPEDMFTDFREEGGRKRERERNINVREKHWSVTWDQTHNLGMCPDQKLNPWPFSLWNNTPTNWATLARAWDLFIFWLTLKLVSWGCYIQVAQTGWLKTPEIYSLTALGARVWTQGVGRAMSSLKPVGQGESSLASPSFWWPQAYLGLWQHHPSICPHPHMAFSLCVRVQISFYI